MGGHMIKTQSEDVSLILKEISAELLVWHGKATQEVDAKQIVFPILEYGIRMTWLGRRDKLRTEQYEAINKLSALLIPTEIGFSPATFDGVALKDQDHYRLAREVFDGIWSLYMSENQMVLPKPITTQRQSLWHWIKSILSGRSGSA